MHAYFIGYSNTSDENWIRGNCENDDESSKNIVEIEVSKDDESSEKIEELNLLSKEVLQGAKK